jgi:DNA helicase-2/ATP-dependent DNA helicase PcrA
MDIAVLYRLNAQADLLVEAFEEEGLPCRVYGPKADPGGPEDIYEPRAEKVSLMTLHASKGLEFPVVLIAGCEDGLLPMGLAAFESDIEEERRLFYVGMTRAKERLVLVNARSRRLWGEALMLKASPFVIDIPDDLKVRDHLPAEPHRKVEARAQMKLF